MRLRVPLFCLVVAAVLSCAGDGPTGPAQRVPAQLAFTAGTGQSGTVGAALPAPLVVLVTDARGRPVQNAAVQFLASAGSVAPVTVATDATGIATAIWTLGTTPGTQTVSAQIAGIAAQFTSASAVAGPVARVLIDPDSVTLTALLDSTAVTARLVDAFNNAATGAASFIAVDPTVATVTSAGRITAVGPGVTYIRATAGTALADSLRIVVRQVPTAMTVAPGITIVAQNTTTTLTIAQTDAGGSAIVGPAPSTLRFTSADPTIATVDPSTGVVTGIAPGVVTITAEDLASPTLRDAMRLAVATSASIIATAIASGSNGNARVTGGTSLVVPIVIDLSRPSANGTLGAAELALRFDPTVLRLDSARVATRAVGNLSESGEYAIAYAAIDPAGTGAPTLATLYLSVLPTAPRDANANLELRSTFTPRSTTFASYTPLLMLTGRIIVR